MNIAVVGTGYVGLVSGTCFAEMGNFVVCVDNNEEKVEKLASGEMTIYEPGLSGLFRRNIKSQRLSFTTDLQVAVRASQIIFLALPTPPGEDGSADLSYVIDVAGQLGSMIKEYRVIVNKSTVPVGTSERVRCAIAKNTTADFDVVSNPEFLREGAAVDDFLKPDRVVIGISSERAEELMRRLYAPFIRQGNPIYVMDERSAEMTKYAANSYLATRITFMNEIANLCEKVGANVEQVRKGMGSDSRIGKRFLFPGVGYGGSCFPKDVKALHKIATDNSCEFDVLRSVMHVNEEQKYTLVKKLKAYFGKDLPAKHLAIWGLAFKPNTDDIRESPALYTIDSLLEQSVSISAFDPEAIHNTRLIYGNRISFATNQYEVLKAADALLILTEWSVFRVPNFEKVAALMKQKIIFDGRNLYSIQQMKNLGFYYNSIGRETVLHKK